MFSRGGYWYLVVAEGGTAHGHMVTIARADAPDGPYESNPANPILSHRSTTDPVQSTGHADLVELADGGWAIVHLGTRHVDPSRSGTPTAARPSFPESTGSTTGPSWSRTASRRRPAVPT